MGVMYYILSPFSWLLNFFYSFTDSYGMSLILLHWSSRSSSSP